MKFKGKKLAIVSAMIGSIFFTGAVPVIADGIESVESRLQVADSVVEIDTNYSEMEDITDVSEKTQKDSFEDKAVAISDLDVKKSASDDAEVTGKLAAKNIAKVVSSEKGWTEIESGELKGFVKSESLCFGDEAEAVALLNGKVQATVKNDDTNSYKDSSAKEVADTHAKGDKLKVVGSDEDHVLVEDEDKNRSYIKHSDVDIHSGLNNGKTKAQIEEEARKKAEEEAKKKAEEEARKKAEEEAKKKAEEEFAAKAAQEAAESQVSYGVDTSGWSSGVASAYGGATDPGCGSITANGSYVSESSMGVAIPLSWGRNDLLGHTVLISYGGKTVTAVINDLGNMGGGSRALDLQPGVFRAFGADSCNGWGLREVQYKIL